MFVKSYQNFFLLLFFSTLTHNTSLTNVFLVFLLLQYWSFYGKFF